LERPDGVAPTTRPSQRWLARLIDSRTNTQQSESALAAWTAYDVALFAGGLTLLHMTFYVMHPEAQLQDLLTLATVSLVLYAVAMWMARRGRQLGAALTVTIVSVVQILVGVSRLGWQSGLHLYLISTGVLVFVIFTERQAPLRWLFIGVSAVVFVVAQTLVEPLPSFPVSGSGMRFMFSINAVLTVLLVFTLAGLSHFRTSRARADAARLAARAARLANTDELTGLDNRRPIMRKLDDLGNLGGYCVAIGDIDHFKRLNDTYGHTCGDVALEQVASVLRARVRATDSVGRWGGEEFIVVLPDTKVDDARLLMERVRQAIAEAVVWCGQHDHEVTISIGVADGHKGPQWNNVVKRADDALYDAKVAGRNVVRVRPLERSLFDPFTLENPRVTRSGSGADLDAD